MNQSEFLLHDQKKQLTLQAERIAIYLQGEIIEAYSENNEVYYLFFNKYRFLTAMKATKLRRSSYIEAAFKKGMIFDAPHPFINVLLSTNQPIQAISSNKLQKKLESTYSPQENSFILTFFESFIPRKQLFNEISSKFYEYRRNGQMFLGYQIVRILMDFVPNHSLVKTLSNDIIFQKYAILYDNKSEELLPKDLIFAEKVLYHSKENDHSFQQLTTHLEKHCRWIDLIALYLFKLIRNPSLDYYMPLINLLHKYLNETEMTYILEQLSQELSSFLPLQNDLFNQYVKTHNIEKIFNMISNQDLELSNSQIHIVTEMLQYLDSESDSFQPEKLSNLLKHVMDVFPEKAEGLLHISVISLLERHNLEYIKAWLDPFKKDHETLQIFKTIDRMQKYSEDLEEMQTLGELYYEYKQLDKAIECFNWEMELKPTEPKPLKWLSKIYRELGMTQESENYRQLCIHIQKWA